MNKTDFDLCLKKLKNPNDSICDYGDQRYESKDEFNTFCECFTIEDKKKYSKELTGEKPKMASYASSSRFIYKTFCNPKNLDLINIKANEREFEKIIKGDVRANFDMYCENDNNHYYFEGKCHEIFDSHSPVFKKSYSKIFDTFDIKYESCGKNNDSIKIVDDIFEGVKGRKTFDIKQFICHVLAIKADENRRGQDFLIYLLYAPRKLKKDYSSLYERFEREYRSSISYIQKKIDLNKTIKFKLYYKVSVEDIEPIEFEEVKL